MTSTRYQETGTCTSPPGAGLRRNWRFAVVLAASLLLGVAQPLTSGLLDEEGSFSFFYSLLIAAVLLLVFERRDHRRTALSLGLAAFLVLWVGEGIGGPVGDGFVAGALLLGSGFFGFALYRILCAILTRRASADSIFGAVCGYLLLGIIWSLLYAAVDVAFPGSFTRPASGGISATPTPSRAGDGPPEGTGAASSRVDRGTLAYYSFITLATVGYGDVTPVTPLARTLAWIEAIAGQFYLAILVAALVALNVARATNNRDN